MRASDVSYIVYSVSGRKTSTHEYFWIRPIRLEGSILFHTWIRVWNEIISRWNNSVTTITNGCDVDCVAAGARNVDEVSAICRHSADVLVACGRSLSQRALPQLRACRRCDAIHPLTAIHTCVTGEKQSTSPVGKQRQYISQSRPRLTSVVSNLWQKTTSPFVTPRCGEWIRPILNPI